MACKQAENRELNEEAEKVTAPGASGTKDSKTSSSQCNDNDNKPSTVSAAPAYAQKKPNFAHPIYEKISVANGIVNRMKVETLREKLGELSLSTRGTKEVLQKRLKTWIKESKLAEANVADTSTESRRIDYYVVVDLEATCEKERPEGYLHEVIEFPALLLNSQTLAVESEFWTYCRPQLNTKLSDFCTELTGIEQHTVDVAPTFPVVLDRFSYWLEQNLKPESTFAMATDGPWDINRFIQRQCEYLKVEIPYYFKKWVNVRKHFSNFYKLKNVNLEQMLNHLGMTFQGRPHKGIDDARNISRIVAQLIRDGCDVRINDYLKKDFT